MVRWSSPFCCFAGLHLFQESAFLAEGALPSALFRHRAISGAAHGTKNTAERGQETDNHDEHAYGPAEPLQSFLDQRAGVRINFKTKTQGC